MSDKNATFKCDLCRVTMTDGEQLEAHFTGKRHIKNVRNVDLRAQQEGKAVYVTRLGCLKLPEIHSYMSSFGAVTNLIPGKNRDKPELLHHVIVEFESEDVVVKILRTKSTKHRIQIPGGSEDSQPRYQEIVIYERKFREARRSPTPPECPGVCHDQVMMRLSLLVDPEDQLAELTGMLDLDPDEVKKRVNICINMQRTFANSDYSRCIVYPFGSSVNGLGFPGCDLDIYMDLDQHEAAVPESSKDGPLASVPVTVTERQKVRTATKILSSVPQCSRLTPIINARVPIVKFIHRPTGIHCDVSFKNRMSVQNTAYIRLAVDSEARVRPLLLAIRYLAKHHGLAGGGGGMRMSSYALTMIAITFLQQLQRPLLHSVRELQSVPGLDQDIINGWNCNFSRDLSKARPLPENSCTVFQLLKGFFAFISDLDTAGVVLCPLLGRVIPKADLAASFPPDLATDTFLAGPDKLKLESGLCVQDPFELNHNVCRNLPDKAVLNLVAYCKEMLRLLELMSTENAPSGGICSLFRIEMKGIVQEENLNITKVLAELSPEQIQIFNNCFKLIIPNNLLKWFQDLHQDSGNSDNVLIHCGEYLMEMVLGDCLKLERYEVGGDPGKIILGQKRCSTDTDTGQSEPKKIKSEENSNDYKKSSSWTLWSLVWPRRKQIASEIEKGTKTTVEWEAAITESVTKGDVRLADPEAVIQVHLLTKAGHPNTVLVGCHKIKSRKKSFESLVQWLGPYTLDLVKRFAEEKGN